MPRSVVVLLDNAEGQVVVKEACRSNGFRLSEFEELIQAEVEQTGKQRKKGLWDSFDDILDRIRLND